MIKSIAKILALLALTGLFSTMALAKSAPPAELEGIFAEFGELEEILEEEDWDAALATVKEIDEAFAGISANISENAGASVTKDFKLIQKNLRKAMLKKDYDKTVRNFIALQNLVLDIMDSYDYETHPLIGLITKYLDEAAEKAEKGNWKGVEREIEEIDSIFKKAGPLMQKQGIAETELDAYSELIEQVENAIEAKNLDSAESGIGKMQSDYEAILEKL